MEGFDGWVLGVSFCGVGFDCLPGLEGLGGEGFFELVEVVFGFADVFVGGFVGELAV